MNLIEFDQLPRILCRLILTPFGQQLLNMTPSLVFGVTYPRGTGQLPLLDIPQSTATQHVPSRLRNCVSFARGHMLDATPVMGWVGWGGDDKVFLHLNTWWMPRNCVSFARGHMLDATPVMGWVGWGGVKFLHIERKITSVVHSHPRRVMFTSHDMQNKT